jgi:hypothetical protein
LVDLFEYMMMHGLTYPKLTKPIFASHNLVKAPKKQETGVAFGVGPRREINLSPFSFCKSCIYRRHGK